MADFPGLKQFRQEGCLSYLFFDRQSLEAVVIDPLLDLMEDYLEYIAGCGLRVTHALDSHTHADHYSATHLFKSRFNSSIGMSHQSKSSRPALRLRAGDRIRVGQWQLVTQETPGHTPDSLCFQGPGLVFTGDTLLIGGSGRTDFPGALASDQWKSLHEVLGKLPGDTLVFPGHDYSDLLFSTMETEMRSNSHWLLPDSAAFTAFKDAEVIPQSDDVKQRVQFNCASEPPERGRRGGCGGTACGATLSEKVPVATINVEKYAHKLDGGEVGTCFVDVRERDEYQGGHMPRTENIPLSELGFHLKVLKEARRVYVSCLSGRRSALGVKTLNYVGLKDVVNVAGGFKAWENAGLQVERRA